MSVDSNFEHDHIPVRLTRLETNVDRLTADVKELTRAVSDNIKSQAELINTLSDKVTSAGVPNWQTWGGFLAVMVAAVALIFTVIDYKTSALEKQLEFNNEKSLLRHEITSLKIKTEQNLVDN